MVKLVASSALRYASKQLQAGEEFEASESDARVLRGASKATDAPAPCDVAEGTPEAQPRKPRSYKRRDMFAERSKDNE